MRNLASGVARGGRRRTTIFVAAVAVVVLAAAAALVLIDRRSSSDDDAHVFVHDGQDRDYLLHLPVGLRSNSPLVLVLHGLGSNGAEARAGTGLDAIANEYSFAVAYPTGTEHPEEGPHWNAKFTGSTGADDVGFLAALAAHLQDAHDLDPERTYVVGISNGGFMAYTLACDASEVFAGFASVMATMSPKHWTGCTPTQPRPVLHIHGVEDDAVPVGGSVARDGGRAPAVTDVIDRWARLNRTTRIATARFGSTRATFHRGGVNGNEVWLYLIDDFGHEWPKSETGTDASAVISKFFGLDE